MLYLPALLLVTGCAEISYYMQSVDGHLSIVHNKKDIEDLIADKNTDKKLAKRLQLVRGIRQFAIDELALPDSGSYTDYADLGRNFVLKNLFAAEAFSIKPKQWCYPVIGCAGYRGYFNEQQLERFSNELKQQGYDIYIANVPAYSTLGWFNDPVLNTFIYWPDYLLAGLIFHELSHQHVYVDGDSQFNESFAVAVQQSGVEIWLTSNGELDKLNKYRQHINNRKQVIQLIIRSREELKDIYATTMQLPEKKAAKEQAIEKLKSQYQDMSAGFDVPDGFSRWFGGDINNARLASISTYYAYVPAFKNLLKQNNNNFTAFLGQVKAISELSVEQRKQCMQYWQSSSQVHSDTRHISAVCSVI